MISPTNTVSYEHLGQNYGQSKGGGPVGTGSSKSAGVIGGGRPKPYAAGTGGRSN